MVAHPYQYKAAALPEAPQLRRIAEADGKIITTAPPGRTRRQSTADLCLRAGGRGAPRYGLHDARPASRLKGRYPCAASDCATRFPRGRRKPPHTALLSSADNPPSSTSQRAARHTVIRRGLQEMLSWRIHHSAQIQRRSTIVRPRQ
ncbi:Uncharacterised protein [Salmonella enterica subsp. enterica]|nr:Uncharacterised protein [Salmonella enterica subsp. enterica]